MLRSNVIGKKYAKQFIPDHWFILTGGVSLKLIAGKVFLHIRSCAKKDTADISILAFREYFTPGG